MRGLSISLLLCLIVGLASAAPLFVRGTVRSFKQFSNAGGVGGNALAEAKAKFPGTAATLSAATITQFNAEAHCAVLAEQAFLDAGAVASSNRATSGVSVGLFKNKVLKIYSTLLVTQAQVAQNGGKASASQQAQIDDLTQKLAVNVAVDKTNAGLQSQFVDFACPSA